MTKNEYLDVKTISQITKQSARNVRRIIKKIENEVSNELLHQDNNNCWLIHRLLLGRFKPQRIRTDKYYALSIDPCHHYSESEITEILQFVCAQMKDENLEINYVVEQKKSNDQNHIHCYVKCGNKRKLLESIRLGFSTVSYKQTSVFDLEGWKRYITKDGSAIATLKD
jgi:hypothetical protein